MYVTSKHAVKNIERTFALIKSFYHFNPRKITRNENRMENVIQRFADSTSFRSWEGIR